MSAIIKPVKRNIGSDNVFEYPLLDEIDVLLYDDERTTSEYKDTDSVIDQYCKRHISQLAFMTLPFESSEMCMWCVKHMTKTLVTIVADRSKAVPPSFFFVLAPSVLVFELFNYPT